MFLEAILGNLGLGVVVLDPPGRCRSGTRGPGAVGRARRGGRGRAVPTLDIGLPFAQLAESIDLALSNPPRTSELVVEAVNRKGRTFKCEVRTLTLSAMDGKRHGVILLMSQQAADGVPSKGGTPAPAS